tara:strand:- start:88 stop:408 length:321 start_codon:yes stop_codon:yes gene_type:complete
MGHVKNPGSYLVDENADILTILAQAGGPLSGAKLNEVILYSKDSHYSVINLDSQLESGQALNVEIKPNDTLYIKETAVSFILSKGNIINSILQVLNIYFTINRYPG